MPLDFRLVRVSAARVTARPCCCHGNSLTVSVGDMGAESLSASSSAVHPAIIMMTVPNVNSHL